MEKIRRIECIKPSDLERILFGNGRKLINGVVNNLLIEMVNKEGRFRSIPILEASFNQQLKHINSGAPIMFVSAFHSLDPKVDHTQEEIDNQNRINKDQTRKLIDDLHKSRYFFVMIGGHWICYSETRDEFVDNPEDSFMVVGYDMYGNIVDFEKFKQFGIELCNKYNQNDVMIGRKIDDGYQIDYYNVMGRIDLSFNNYDTIDNNTLKKIIDRYNKMLINSTNDDIDIVKQNNYGFSTLYNNRNKKRQLNIEFSGTEFDSDLDVIIGHNLPTKYGPGVIINTYKDN